VFSYFLNLNTFKITQNTKTNVDFEIRWNNDTIYKNGYVVLKNILRNRYRYGSNLFCFYINGKYYQGYEHTKYNNWNFYRYEIQLVEKKNFEIIMKVVGVRVDLNKIVF